MIGRDFHHTQGKDMVFIESEEDMVPKDYYIEFVPIKKERRYHVFKGNVIAATYKYGGERDGKGKYCRNHSTGWKFSSCKMEPKIAGLAIKAVEAVGLDFGAVDIIIGEDDKAYVLEVNTAPGLIEKRAKDYAEAIKAFKEDRVEYQDVDFSLIDEYRQEKHPRVQNVWVERETTSRTPRWRVNRTSWEYTIVTAESDEDVWDMINISQIVRLIV
jgi:hypothetical protein